jgi:hypothetical protein
MRGLEAKPTSSELREALEEVSKTLTLEQVSQVCRARNVPTVGAHEHASAHGTQSVEIVACSIAADNRPERICCGVAAKAPVFQELASGGMPPQTIAWRSPLASHRYLCWHAAVCGEKSCVCIQAYLCVGQNTCDTYVQASAAALTVRVRQSLRGDIARAAGLPLHHVTLERIDSCSSDGGSRGQSDSSRVHAGLEIELHVRLGPDEAAGGLLMQRPQVRSTEAHWNMLVCAPCTVCLAAHHVVKAAHPCMLLTVRAQAALCSEAVRAVLGAPHAGAPRTRLVNLAAAAGVHEGMLGKKQQVADAERAAAQQADRRLMQVPWLSPLGAPTLCGCAQGP